MEILKKKLSAARATQKEIEDFFLVFISIATLVNVLEN